MVATAHASTRAPLFSSMDKNSPSKMASVPLPLEALALRASIRKTHKSKFFHFSLLDMRKVAVPPVRIPDMYRTSRAKALRVGGREVPYTRLMWERTKRAVFPKGQLETIRENGGMFARSRH